MTSDTFQDISRHLYFEKVARVPKRHPCPRTRATHVPGLYINGPIQRKVAPLSMWGDADAVHIEMDVPGIALADLSVSVENGLLMIRGRRRAIERQSETIHEERFFFVCSVPSCSIQNSWTTARSASPRMERFAGSRSALLFAGHNTWLIFEAA